MPEQPKGDNNSGLENFLAKVGEAIKDASELQVLTFSGDIKMLQYKDKADKNLKLDWEWFFTNVKNAQIKALSLVAATLVQIDGDTVLFISNAAIADAIKQAHVDATIAAQKYRTDLVLGLAKLLGYSATSG